MLFLALMYFVSISHHLRYPGWQCQALSWVPVLLSLKRQCPTWPEGAIGSFHHAGRSDQKDEIEHVRLIRIWNSTDREEDM